MEDHEMEFGSRKIMKIRWIINNSLGKKDDGEKKKKIGPNWNFHGPKKLDHEDHADQGSKKKKKKFDRNWNFHGPKKLDQEDHGDHGSKKKN